MLFEHWIYSLAIAIIAGMIHMRRTGRDYSWIIIASAYAPDFDIIADAVFGKLGMPVFGIQHGEALVLQVVRYGFLDAFVFAGIGFGARLSAEGRLFGYGKSFSRPGSVQMWAAGAVRDEGRWGQSMKMERLEITYWDWGGE